MTTIVSFRTVPTLIATIIIMVLPGFYAAAQDPTQRKVASVNTFPRRDISTMPRPIDMRDTVWMEDLTMLEVRDLLAAGKTSALVLTGGIEENGPYVTNGKHNTVLRAMGESIARRLGNALIAPIVTLEPGDPNRARMPGTILLSPATYKAVLADMARSLKTQGFKKVFFLGDSGGNQAPMREVSTLLNEEWKGQGVTTYFIPEYYDTYGEIEKFEQDVLEIHEKLEGFHDDYYISALVMTVDPNGVRFPERMKAGKTTINGIDLAPAAKTIENGKKLVAFRTEATIKAIEKAILATNER